MIPVIHQSFIDNAIAKLKNDPRILGLAIGGSYLENAMDEFSDLDLVIAVQVEEYEPVMRDRFVIAKQLGNFLTGFTGEHVNEPRLLICLYGPPLLKVDLKFVSLADIAKRVEDPVILWERENGMTEALQSGEARFPSPELQWIEDRFWIWIYYIATKIGRGELFDTIESLSFLRQVVIGPLALMKNHHLPRSVRKIELHAPEVIPLLQKTVPAYNLPSCIEAVKVIIKIYQELRSYHQNNDLKIHSEVERLTIDYLNELAKDI